MEQWIQEGATAFSGKSCNSPTEEDAWSPSVHKPQVIVLLAVVSRRTWWPVPLVVMPKACIAKGRVSHIKPLRIPKALLYRRLPEALYGAEAPFVSLLHTHMHLHTGSKLAYPTRFLFAVTQGQPRSGCCPMQLL